MNFCSKCGFKIDPTSNFCAKCGCRIIIAPDKPKNKEYISDLSKNNSSKLKSFNKLEKIHIVILLFFPLVLLTMPGIFFDLHMGREEYNEFKGLIYHNLKYIAFFILGLVIFFNFLFIVNNFKKRNYQLVLVLFFNGVYLTMLLMQRPLSSSFFRFIDLNGAFKLNRESLFYGISLILIDAFFLIKPSK